MPEVKCDACRGEGKVFPSALLIAATEMKRPKPLTCVPCAGKGKISTPDDHALELAWAERDEALIMLQRFELLIARVGGHHHPPDQATIREGQSLLAKHGRYKNRGDARPPIAPPWANDPAPWHRKS